MAKLTFCGHACFVLEDGGKSVIIDPWLASTGNPVATVKGDEINVDAVLVTHGHFDHMGDAVGISKNSGATIIGTAELAGYFQRQGAESHGMHIGGAHQFPFGWVKLTPAWHGSAVMGENGNETTGNPCGFLVKLGDKLVYHTGDTGLFGDMKLIGEMNEIDVMLLPIGDNYVMGPEDAAKAIEFVKPKIAIPMHYNTFELIQQDPNAFKEKVESSGITKVQVMQPGDIFEF